MNLTDKPIIQDFDLEGVKHISVQEAFELISADQVFFLDVREEDEQALEFFDFQNVFFYPMSAIMENIQFIPKEIPLIVVCNEGVRSCKVANVLNRQGFTTVANLDGGIYAWKAKQLPIIKGMAIKTGASNSCSPDSCGCGCDGCG
jgi:rhodanese-related sulfurtransferase